MSRVVRVDYFVNRVVLRREKNLEVFRIRLREFEGKSLGGLFVGTLKFLWIMISLGLFGGW